MRRALLSLALTISLAIIGCDKSDQTTSPNTILSGDIVGFASLFEADGTLSLDRSGVFVSITGSTITASTDSVGHYVLKNLPSGSYTILFSKLGYGSTRINLFQFVGGGQAYAGSVQLSKSPSVAADSVRNPILGDLSSFEIKLTQPINSNCGYVLFFGKTRSTSYDPSTFLFAAPGKGPFAAGLKTHVVSELFLTLKSVGFAAGDSAFVVAYTGTGNLRLSGYTDIATGRMVYTSISTQRSNSLGFVVQ